MATVNEYEVKALFNFLDDDGSGEIELAELLGFLQRGPITAEAAAARVVAQRKKVSKLLATQIKQRAPTEYQMRHLFKAYDGDGDGVMTQAELENFVRNELKLSQWDMSTSDLDAFYDYVDENGDGIEVEEILDTVFKGHERKEVPPAHARPSFRVQLLHRAAAPNNLGGLLQPGRHVPQNLARDYLPLENAQKVLYPEQVWKAGVPKKSSSDTSLTHTAAFLSVGRKFPARNRSSVKLPKLSNVNTATRQQGIRMDLF